MQTPDDEVRAQLLTFSLRPVAEIEAIAAEHAEAPHRRIGQRALADDMVTLVHGAEAAAAANEAADVLFASDPTGASAAAFEMLAGEIPITRVRAVDVDDLVGVLVTAGLASSNGDARRTLDQNAYSVNGVKLSRERPAQRPETASTGGTCCCAVARSSTTSSKLFPDGGCGAVSAALA